MLTVKDAFPLPATLTKLLLMVMLASATTSVCEKKQSATHQPSIHRILLIGLPNALFRRLRNELACPSTVSVKSCAMAGWCEIVKETAEESVLVMARVR